MSIQSIFYSFNRFASTNIYGTFQNLDQVDIFGNIVENSNAIISRNLSVGGNISVTGNQTITGTLNVDGNTTISNLVVAGNVIGDLNVEGVIYSSENLLIDKRITTVDLEVTGDVISSLNILGNLNTTSLSIDNSPFQIYFMNILSQGFSLSTDSFITSNGVNISDKKLSYISTLSSNAQTQINLLAPIDSPTFTGVPYITTTPTLGDASHQIADTNFIAKAITEVLNSPIFTGTPTCEMAASGTNTKQIASIVR